MIYLLSGLNPLDPVSHLKNVKIAGKREIKVSLVEPNNTTPINAKPIKIVKNMIVNNMISIYALSITSRISANLLENPK